MTVESKQVANKIKFNFYTYDVRGNDVVIPIFAASEPEAWVEFDFIYGAETPVDVVKECH